MYLTNELEASKRDKSEGKVPKFFLWRKKGNGCSRSLLYYSSLGDRSLGDRSLGDRCLGDRGDSCLSLSQYVSDQ
jgi:hypothetical protein